MGTLHVAISPEKATYAILIYPWRTNITAKIPVRVLVDNKVKWSKKKREIRMYSTIQCRTGNLREKEKRKKRKNTVIDGDNRAPSFHCEEFELYDLRRSRLFDRKTDPRTLDYIPTDTFQRPFPTPQPPLGIHHPHSSVNTPSTLN